MLSMPSVGLEVTPGMIRFLELVSKGSARSVGRYGAERLETVADENMFPDDPKVIAALTELKHKHRLGFVRVALPEEKAYIFSSEVPDLSPDEIKTAIEFQLEEHVPVPPREAVFDYQVVSPNPATKHLRVSVTVIPHLLVARYRDVIVKAGMIPTSFQVSAQASANALIKEGEMAPCIIVNFGEQDARLYLVSHRTVHFTLVVHIGGAALTEAIKKYFSISTEEAERVKLEEGVTRKKEDAELFFSLANTLSALKDEIEKLGVYWETHVERYSETKQKIGKIILCGRESNLRGLPEYLEASLETPVELGNVWTNVASFDSYIPPIDQKESPSYASPIGLSLS
jgi:type IV pilus assembly protein PilM